MTDNEKKILIQDNHKLIYGFLAKNKLNVEEYYGIASIGYMKAFKKYNKEISQLSTYVYQSMLYELLIYQKNKNAYKRRLDNFLLLSVEQDISDIKDYKCDEYFQETIITNTLKRISKILTKTQYKIIQLSLNEYKDDKIAKILNTTRQNIYSIKQGAIKKINKHMPNLYMELKNIN